MLLLCFGFSLRLFVHLNNNCEQIVADQIVIMLC